MVCNLIHVNYAMWGESFQPHFDDSRYFNFLCHFMVLACHDRCTILSIFNQETIKLHENTQASILGW